MTVYSNPASWGPPAWVFLHCISLTYPKKPTKETRVHYKQFFESLVHVLPCPSCRVEYSRWLQHHPIDAYLTSRSRLTEWVIQLHNDVNFRNQKIAPPSTSEALKMIRRDCRKYENIGMEMNTLFPNNKKKNVLVQKH